MYLNDTFCDSDVAMDKINDFFSEVSFCNILLF